MELICNDLSGDFAFLLLELVGFRQAWGLDKEESGADGEREGTGFVARAARGVLNPQRILTLVLMTL